MNDANNSDGADELERLNRVLDGVSSEKMFRELFLADFIAAAAAKGVEVKVRGPWFAGGRTRITLPNGEVISITEFFARVRVNRLLAAPCVVCGAKMRGWNGALNLLDGSEKTYRRGRRLGSHYCSNACRQRAYRQRLKVGTNALSVTPEP